jgi:hypothetical protein
MKRVKIISKKYDGSLRDECESRLYAESDETIIYAPRQLQFALKLLF